MDEASDDTGAAPWTIKSMSVEARKLAVACAGKRGQTMASWLETAVRNQAAIEAGDRVTLPDERRPAPSPRSAGLPDTDAMANLAHTMQAVQAVAEAAGLPLPKRVARHAFALLETNLRAARGLPEPAPRAARPLTLEGDGLPKSQPG